MFKRILYQDWTLIVPLISFALTFLVFIGFFIRTILMKKETVTRLANLALQKDETSDSQRTNHV